MKMLFCSYYRTQIVGDTVTNNNTFSADDVETIEAEPLENKTLNSDEHSSSQFAAPSSKMKLLLIFGLLTFASVTGVSIYAGSQLLDQINQQRSNETELNLKAMNAQINAITVIQKTLTKKTDSTDIQLTNVETDIKNIIQDFLNLQNSTPLNIDNIKRRILSLESSLVQIQKSIATPQPSPDNNLLLPKLRDKISTLDQSTSELQKTQFEINERLKKIEDRLRRFINPLQKERALFKKPNLLTSFLRVQTAARGGEPFLEKLSTFAQVVTGNAILNREIELIRSFARNGVKTRPALNRDFSKLTSTILQSSREKNDTLLTRTLDYLSGIVTIRRTGEVKGHTVEAIIARTEARLSENKLEDAISELQRLNGASRAVVLAWMGAAQNRLDLDNSIIKIQNQITLSSKNK